MNRPRPACPGHPLTPPARLLAALLAVVIAQVLAAPAAALTVSGRLEWLHKVELRAVENGIVEEVLVTPGQHVRRGDLMLKLDQRRARANLLEARARLARADIALAKAEREVARTEELFDRGLIAIEEKHDAELAAAAARAGQESARAAEAEAVVLLERTELRAPFDGIVVARNAWAGAVVYPSLQQAPLIAVAPTDRMLARVLVTADVLRRYRPDQPAKVSVRGRPRDARVYSLGVEAVRIDPEGAVYELDLIFATDPSEILRPSEFVQVTLP